jgi:hypothetical protein
MTQHKLLSYFNFDDTENVPAEKIEKAETPEPVNPEMDKLSELIDGKEKENEELVKKHVQELKEQAGDEHGRL